MDVKDAIIKRRAYRSLDPVEITETVIKDLAECAQLAPSCKNSQPWKFIFLKDPEQLQKIFTTLTPANKWVENASMVIIVFSKTEDGCIIKERLYYLYETGLATAFILLRATELGLVAHPIAGFEETKIKSLFKIPALMKVISLIVIGKRKNMIDPDLSDLIKYSERTRPSRKQLKEFVYLNSYNSVIKL
ncbi:MAG: nitroreductase family protein [Candidatus Hermodarchaeota archaeon]